MAVVNRKGEYDEQIRQFLSDSGLEWFYENPCITAHDMKANMELNFSADQMKGILEIAKEKIDRRLSRYSCDGHSVQDNPNATFPELRYVLLGKTGDGKSSLGNLLLGIDKFKAASNEDPGTTTIQYESACIDGCNLRIIDTPGLQHGKEVDVGLELSKLFNIFHDGVHLFILVINIANPRVTDSDLKVFKDLKEKLGEGFLQHMMIIFTSAASHFQEGTQETLQTYLENSKTIAELCNHAGGRTIAVENRAVTYEQELFREKALNLMKQTVSAASDECYTAELFEQAKQDLENALKKRREERKRQERDLDREIQHHVKETVNISLSEQVSIISEKINETVQKILPQVTKRVDWMDDLEHKEHCTIKICEMLKEQVRPNVLDHLKAIIQGKVNNHLKSPSEYLEDLKEKNPREVQLVGEDCIKPLINQRHMRLTMNAVKERVRNEIFKDIKPFLIKNVTHHNDIHGLYTLWSEQAEFSEFTEIEKREMLQECLQHPEVRKAIESYRERKKTEALSRVSVLASEKVLKFICSKTQQEIKEIKEVGMISEVDNLTAEVIHEIDTKPLRKNVVRQEICDILDVTIENITNASYMEKFKMMFSSLLSLNYIKWVMTSFVGSKRDPNQSSAVKS